jgi:hypothetical protein
MIDFGILPILGTVILVVGVAGYVGYVWLRAHSKPCDGVQMGPYEIRGRIGSGKTFVPFFGNLAEVTDWFFVSEVKSAFKETIIPDVQKRINSVEDQTEKDNLKGALETLDNLFFKEKCRLYMMRSGSFGGVKDLFVQYGDITRSLDDFASHSIASRNSVSLGPVTEHYVEGRIDTFPGEIHTSEDYKQFGPFIINMYLPFERGAEKLSGEQQKEAEKVMTALTGLAQLIAFIPSGLNFHNILKVKDEEVHNLNLENHDLQRRIAAKNNEINLARSTMGDLQPDGGEAKMPDYGRFKAVDLALSLVALLMFGALFGFLGGPTFIGVAMSLIGSIVGYGVSLILISWRGR